MPVNGGSYCSRCGASVSAAGSAQGLSLDKEGWVGVLLSPGGSSLSCVGGMGGGSCISLRVLLSQIPQTAWLQQQDVSQNSESQKANIKVVAVPGHSPLPASSGVGCIS